MVQAWCGRRGIEGGCAFTAEALHSADKFVVDDVPLAEYFDKIGRDRVTEDGRPDPEFPGGMPNVYGTIGELVAGTKRGRENAHVDEGFKLIQKLTAELADVAKVEQNASMQGRRIVVIYAPK